MSVLKLSIIADPSKFRAGMNKVQTDLAKLKRTTDSVSKGMNKALGAVGLTVGLTALTNVLKNSAKAASEDIKSQALLANALRNTIGATDDTIASAESYIKKTQLSSAVLDDELRPALAKAVLATGTLTNGQRILDIALDVSAQTGKDLSSVTGALSKAFNGNTTSLKKLLPGLDLTGDALGEVEKKFAGAAEVAAKNDPYKRISIIFAELQETIGMSLLPALEEFSAYLASTKGQESLQKVATIFGFIGTLITKVTSFVVQNINVLTALGVLLVGLRVGWMAITGAVAIYTLATKIAAIQTKNLRIALISTGIGALVVAVGTLAALWMSASDNAEEYGDTVDGLSTADTVTFFNANNLLPGQSPADGWENFTPLADAIRDPRLTEAMKEALKGQLHKVITIDYLKGQIRADGKLIWTAFGQASADAIKENATKIKDALDKEIGKIKTVAEKFRDAVGIAFGARGEDENTIFNVDFLLGKLKRITAAAVGFGANIAKINKLPGGQFVSDQLIAMGPAAGNIAAKALLANPQKLNEVIGLSKGLYNVGASVQAQASVAGNATYEININKAVVSAADIIREIKIYEKKLGKKFLVSP